jgi:hypothetical protein
MWKLLDENLEVIRPKLASDLGSEIEAMLLQLETDLAQCAPPSGRGCAAARSSNCGDRDAVARIVEWFRLPTQTPHRSYPLAVADDVAIETVNRYYPSYRLAPNVAIPEDLFMPGVTLTAWVDVFFIFLENVVKHSHTAEPRDLSISASETDSAVTISVVNEIALGVRCAATDAAIARTQADLDRGDYSSAVLKEGGSGFLKVRKIVEHDLGDVIRFDVGYYREEQQDYFSVVLTVGKDV